MSGTEKNIIHFLSASDRINYGDLLFPIIFKKYAEANNFKINFFNYGIAKSDLSDYGAIPTSSYLKLLKNVENVQGGKLVVGGGEVFFANWNKLYSFINPVYFKFNKYKIIKKLKLPKLLLANNKVEVPFCPSLKELRNDTLKLYFSSVGGSFSGKLDDSYNIKIKETLKSASLLSMRDNRSIASMKQIGLNANLVPDSAIIMSDFFTKKTLADLISLKPLKPTDRYIFLQVGNFKGPQNVEQFALELRELSAELELHVVLCPIGKAAGHEDHLILQQIKSYDDSFNYIDPKSIFDVMYLIANSSLYLGTSLHGMITAQSFSVPFICLNKKLVKVSSYLKTWIHESMDCLEFDEIYKATDIFKEWDSVFVHKQTLKQKQLVRNNLNFILSDEK